MSKKVVIPVCSVICFLVIYAAHATLNFSNNSSEFILQNNSSEIRVKNTGTYGSQDIGIVDNLNNIDFVDSTNNVLIMDDNFELVSGFLSSVSCTVQGNGYSMILNGNLTIPAMTTLKITSGLVIEGNGHTLFIDDFAQILTDTNATLTLRNLIIENAINTSQRPAIAANGSNSTITLDGVNIKFSDDFWFNRGSLFFNNNVLYSGNSKFLYSSEQSSYIAPNSTLLFDKGTTFFYNPANTNDGLIVLQDPTATIYFDGATLQSTPTGLSISDGQMFFENQVNFDVGTQFNTSVFNISQSSANIALRFLDWNFTGQYLAACGQAVSGNTNQIKIYQLNSIALSQLDALKYGSLSAVVNSAVWSSDGQYLAVGGSGAGIAGGFTNNNSLRIYYFDPATLNLSNNPVASVDFGITATISSIDWGGVDGHYLAIGGTGALPVGGFSNNYNLRIYHFNATQGVLSLDTLTTVTSYPFGSSVNTAKWDFSGSYLAVGGFQTAGSCNLKLFKFDPVNNSLNSIQTVSFDTALSTSINALAWTSDSQFLAVGGGSYSNYSTSIQNLDIYRFNPANASPLSFLTFAAPVETASTSYIQIQNLSWSVDNQLLLYSGVNPASGNWSSDIYVFNSTSDIILSELKQMSHASSYAQYASAWNPNGNLFVSSSTPPSLPNGINVNSLVGVSPALVANQDYTADYSSTTSGVFAIDWHPGGNYLAVAGQGASHVGGFNNSNEIRVYRFGSDTLYTNTSQDYGQRVNALSWRPDGDYIAVGGINPAYAVGGFNNVDQVRIYSFTDSFLSAITSVSLGSSSAALYSMAWHPSGNYLALGCYNSQSVGGFLAGTNLRIYSFDGTRLSPIAGAGKDFVYHGNDLTPAGLAWSPDGKYLAVGTCLGAPNAQLDLNLSPTTGNGLQIFEFQNNNSLVQRASWNATSGHTAVLSVNWEFDNRYLAITYNDNYGPLAYGILYFTGSSLQETNVWGSSSGILNVGFFNTNVKFSPDGTKVANTATNGSANNFGYLAIDDFNLQNPNFYYQKINGIFSIGALAWRPDSKYLAIGAYDVAANAPQISVFEVDNLININRQSADGLDIGNLVEANVLSGALIRINGIVKYAVN
jgi:WD40 repeat protein